MKKIGKILYKAILASFIITGIFFVTPTKALETVNTELIKASATAYDLTGVTKSGEYTREGICATRDEWLGRVIIVYQRYPDDSIGNVIGIYESLDTGSTEGLKSGHVVDVWQPDDASCQDFMDRVYEDGCKGKVYIQVIESEDNYGF